MTTKTNAILIAVCGDRRSSLRHGCLAQKSLGIGPLDRRPPRVGSEPGPGSGVRTSLRSLCIRLPAILTGEERWFDQAKGDIW
jgi:hypothetical protein